MWKYKYTYLMALGAPLGVVNLPIDKQRVLSSGIILRAADSSKPELVAKVHTGLHHAVLYALLIGIWNERRLIGTYADLFEMFSKHLGYFVDQGHSICIFHDATIH